MNFQDIAEIVETAKWEDVNKYLEVGWTIVNIYNSAYVLPGLISASQAPNYVLGWMRPSEAPKYPDLTYDYGQPGETL